MSGLVSCSCGYRLFLGATFLCPILSYSGTNHFFPLVERGAYGLFAEGDIYSFVYTGLRWSLLNNEGINSMEQVVNQPFFQI